MLCARIFHLTFWIEQEPNLSWCDRSGGDIDLLPQQNKMYSKDSKVVTNM